MSYGLSQSTTKRLGRKMRQDLCVLCLDNQRYLTTLKFGRVCHAYIYGGSGGLSEPSHEAKFQNFIISVLFQYQNTSCKGEKVDISRPVAITPHSLPNPSGRFPLYKHGSRSPIMERIGLLQVIYDNADMGRFPIGRFHNCA